MKKSYFLLLFFSIFVSAQNVGILEIISPDVTNSYENISETFVVIIIPNHSANYDGLALCYYQLNSDTIIQDRFSSIKKQ